MYRFSHQRCGQFSIRTTDSFIKWAEDIWCSETKMSYNMHKLSMKRRKFFSPPAEDLEHDSEGETSLTYSQRKVESMYKHFKTKNSLYS